MDKRDYQKEEIMVSVCCMTYNHEPYIRDCLEGFVKQKTNFKYEVLIHDDASTDKTADIIREYEKKYPDIIKPIYQTVNQYSKKIDINKEYQYTRVNGKYVAWCEGDDYWIDPLKLQKQYDFMEEHRECSFCTHKVNVINAENNTHILYMPNTVVDQILEIEKYLEYASIYKCTFQTSSYFAQSKYIKELLNDYPEFMKILAYDISWVFYFSTKGKIGYIDDTMSVYRSGSIGSWTSRTKEHTDAIKHYMRVCNMYDECNRYTEYKYEKSINNIIKSHAKEICILSGMSEDNDIDINTYKKYLSFFEKLKVSVIVHERKTGKCNFVHKIYFHIKNWRKRNAI